MSVCMNRTVTHERFLYKLRHFSNKSVYKVISRGGGGVELLTDLIIIIIIFIYCNWVVTRWQWLCYMYTKHEIGYY